MAHQCCFSRFANNIIYATTTREVSIDLQDQFSLKNTPCIFEIRRAISNHSLRTNFYYHLLYWLKMLLWLTVIILDHSSLVHIDNPMDFLIGFNDSYNVAYNQILLIDPLPQVNKVISYYYKKNFKGSYPKPFL